MSTGNINDMELAKFLELAGEFGIRVHFLHGDTWMPSVATVPELPTTGNTTGDVRQVLSTGVPYKWTGSAWAVWSIASGVAWGGITGTLSAQTDLQDALDAKMGSGAYVIVNQDCLLTNQINLGALGSGILKIAVSAGIATISVLTDNSGEWDTAYDHSQASGNPHGATTEDIADSADKRYVTDAQLNQIEYVGATYTPATGSQTVALDCSDNTIHAVTGHASGTAITFTITGMTNNKPVIVSITQGAVASTIDAWFNTIRWAGGVAPTLTPTPGKRDTYGFIKTGTDTYDGFIVGQNA